MNEGVVLPTLMRTIKTPEDLTLTEEYGKVTWNVRAIWHEYSGWYDPSRGITELYGVQSTEIAPALVTLAGGEAPLIARARQFTAEGKSLESLHPIQRPKRVRNSIFLQVPESFSLYYGHDSSPDYSALRNV